MNRYFSWDIWIGKKYACAAGVRDAASGRSNAKGTMLPFAGRMAGVKMNALIFNETG